MVLVLFSNRTIGLKFWTGKVNGLFIVRIAKKMTFFVFFCSVWVVNFEGNPDLFFAISLVDDFYNSSVVPASKVVFTVDNVSDFEIFSPLVLVGVGLVGGNLNAVNLEDDGFIIVVVKVGNFDLVVFLLDDLSS